MKKTWILLLVLGGVFLVAACRKDNLMPTERTQLQIRQIQTRSFDTADHALVMKAVINVLQDDGFIVKNAHLELGLVSASKEFDVEKVEKEEMARRYGLPQEAHFALIESSATVTTVDRQTRVRVNFQITLYDEEHKEVVAVSEIKEGTYYQDFLTKVDKGIFIQKEKL